MVSMRVGDLEGRFFVVAHRGASGYEPENTLTSVRRAVEMGADAVEVDVRVSRDGALVVIHDETVDRTTNGSGRVDELTLKELRSLDAGMGEKIPLLEEVVEAVKGEVVLVVELKVPEAAEPSLKLVSEKGLLDSTVLVSFKREALERVERLDPRAYTGLIHSHPVDPREAEELGCDFILPKYTLVTEDYVSKAHKLGLLVVTWTVDDSSTAKLLKSKGVDGIATNYPDRIIPLRTA